MIGLIEIWFLFAGAVAENVGEPPETVTKDASTVSEVDYLPSLRLEPKKSVANLKEKKRKPASRPSKSPQP